MTVLPYCYNRDMKATCTVNPNHKRFLTTQHVMEEVVVDASGSWIETIASLEVSSKPDPGNLWTCECGAPAKVDG